MFGSSDGRYYAVPVRCYHDAKQCYEEVKPIRGRSEEIRPIGKRRRDWECIVKVSDTAYAVKLYNTNVVTYHEDGSIDLCTGGWPSVSTAEMIEWHSPFRATKRNKNIWAWHNLDGEDDINRIKYIVPADDTSVKFVCRDGRYVPVVPQVLRQRVVDRTSIKELRAKIKPFLDYSKIMLNLSGGWLHLNTMLDLGGEKFYTYFVHGQIIFPNNFTREQKIMMDNVGYRPNENDSRSFVQMLLNCGEDHDQWMRVMYLLLSRFTDAVERDLAFIETRDHGDYKRSYNYYNAKYTVKQFTDLINRILRQHPDAQMVQEVSPNKKFCTNVV